MTDSNPTLRAILFDMDGLLADTEPLQKQAFEIVCRRHGDSDLRITEEMHAEFVGKSYVENARVLIDAFRLPVEPEDLVAEREDAYVDVLQSTRVPPMEGVRELMQAGIAAGLTLAVGTSSIKRFVDVSLERMFAAMASPELNVGIFATIVCGDDPDISARKPAPDIYLRCAERIDVEPPSCMVLEDSGSGILSARRAGIGWPTAVPNKYTHGHDFTGAYGVLRSVQDVVSLDFFPATSALTWPQARHQARPSQTICPREPSYLAPSLRGSAYYGQLLTAQAATQSVTA